MKRLAVLLDGGFVKRKLRKKLSRPLIANDLGDFVQATVALLPDHELFRAYYYDAPPFAKSAVNPIDRSHTHFKQRPEYQENIQLIDQAALLPDFAVRLGECVMQGWELDARTAEAWERQPLAATRTVSPGDLFPKVKQRGVDLRIGLDIAHLTNLRLVDTVCLVTGDSDFIPALKYARRGGLRVALHTMGHAVYADLKKHADLVIG